LFPLYRKQSFEFAGITSLQEKHYSAQGTSPLNGNRNRTRNQKKYQPEEHQDIIANFFLEKKNYTAFTDLLIAPSVVIISVLSSLTNFSLSTSAGCSISA